MKRFTGFLLIALAVLVPAGLSADTETAEVTQAGQGCKKRRIALSSEGRCALVIEIGKR